MQIINNILNKIKTSLDSNKCKDNSNKSENKSQIIKPKIRYNRHGFPTYSPANRKKSK
jgi:hypothetical protein